MEPAVAIVIAAIVAFGAVLGSLYFLSLPSASSNDHTVTFVETGLTPPTRWWATLNGVTETTVLSNDSKISNTLVFSVPNGRYTFNVSSIPGYSALPSAGALYVNDLNVVEGVKFSASLIPIGTAFAIGNPTLSVCPHGHTFVANGCNGGDYEYTVAIESSTVVFGSIMLTVKNDTGAYYPVFPASGGFAITNVSGGVAAEINTSWMGGNLWMTTNWIYYATGVYSSSPLTALDAIVIDVGPADPSGSGLTLLVDGDGNYSGTIGPIGLP